MNPRGIAVVDVGHTNTKVILFGPDLVVKAERKITSPHHDGKHYKEIDVEPMLVFAARSLVELDAILPVDTIVVSAHGACIVTLNADGQPAVPIMDYMSDPPHDMVQEYARLAPAYAETFSPQLPLALLHAMQLFWQDRIFPREFAAATTILPLMQYVAARLGGKYVTEISSMGCQSHLLDLNTLGPSSLARSQGWSGKFAPRANAWDTIGTFEPLRGRGKILAGVHDSNANYLRYLAGGQRHFTLLSTGTWIISFDTDADVTQLDSARDIVANVDVLGRVVACSRFFGGKEYEMISGETHGTPSLEAAKKLVADSIMALPSFTDSGGPMVGTGNKGRISGHVSTPDDLASLASIYCALMVSESLDAIHSQGDIIVDGPFSQNPVFLQILATLRPNQKVSASKLKDGTAAGAACLALMPNGLLPHIDIAMQEYAAASVPGLGTYQQLWRTRSTEND